MNKFKFLNFLISVFSFTKYARTLETESIRGGYLGNFPYQAALIFGSRICNGGIIDTRHILAAASCFIKRDSSFHFKSSIKVIIGTNNLMIMGPNSYDVYIESVYVPLDYFIKKFFWKSSDIAVLTMRRLPLYMLMNIKPLKLPDQYESYALKTATVSGFGGNEPNLAYSIDLHWGKANVLEEIQCKWLYNKSDESHLCARMQQARPGFPSGVCRGDIGAPLVIDDVVIGILIAALNNCNEKKFCGLYTRVSSHLDFIANAKADNCDYLDMECFFL